VSLARRLYQFDPRLKIILGLVLGVLVWHANLFGVVVYGLALCAILYVVGFGQSGGAGKRVLWFAGVWAGLKLGAELLSGQPVAIAMALAGELGLRLAVLMLLGLALAASSSPRRLGLGLAWFLRPFLGAGTWRIALALSLMIHYLPLVWTSLERLSTVMTVRTVRRSWFQRVVLGFSVLLRSLSLSTWRQTVALAVRGLDRPEAWEPNLPWCGKDMAVFSIVLIIALVLAWV
jgi:biotin transport system permease protein